MIFYNFRSFVKAGAVPSLNGPKTKPKKLRATKTAKRALEPICKGNV